MEYIEAMAKKLKLKNFWSLSYDEYLMNVKAARQKYLDLKNSSYSLRDIYLSRLEDKARQAIWRKEKNKLY